MEGDILCPFMNMNVINAVNSLKKWSAFLTPVIIRHALHAQAKILARKFLQQSLLELPAWDLQAPPPAAAVRQEPSPEVADAHPTVSRFSQRTKPDENSES